MTTPSYDAAWSNTSPADVELDSRQRDLISERGYAALIGVFMLIGFAVATAAAWIVRDAVHPWAFLVVGAVGAFVGMEVTARTHHWVASFAGHVLSYASIGLIAAPFVLSPEAGWLRNVLLQVSAGTLLLTAAAAAWPMSVRMFGTFILGGAGAIAAGFLLGPTWSGLLDVPEPTFLSSALAVGVIAYIDYYWTQALRLPRNMDNAVDSACALYADMLHRLMALLDRRVREGR